MGHVAREVEEVRQERRRRLVGFDDRGPVFRLGGPVGIFYTFLEVLRELLRLVLLVLGEACVRRGWPERDTRGIGRDANGAPRMVDS